MHKKLCLWAGVLFKLGIRNLISFFFYQLKLRLGYLKFKTPINQFITGDCFSASLKKGKVPEDLVGKLIQKSNQLINGYHPLFCGQEVYVGSPPYWLDDEIINNNQHWSILKVNATIDKDIKKTWDISRFQWAPILSATYLSTKHDIYLKTLNAWISDWCINNPPNVGVNWVCAQEVSIRMLNMLNTLHIMKQIKIPSPFFISFIQMHCQRIAPTLQYSIAQANNHGVLEATALFVGGSWLENNGFSKKEIKQGRFYAALGRNKLERLVSTLISSDGSFSMYSLNYHRVVLDTLVSAEFWRRKLELKKFSSVFYRRSSVMVNFLNSFVDPTTGDVPNIGTNDGSYLFHLNSCGYRDFRPSVQAGAYFFRRELFSNRNYCNCLSWMDIQPPVIGNISLPPRQSQLFDDSGFAILIPANNDQTAGFIRFPRYKFRPAHSDQLHFDLWYKGKNILSDSGTFSYNTTSEIESLFQGTKGHNTIQFDDQEPMPKLGRFLVANWLRTESYSPLNRWTNEHKWSAAYQIKNGAFHKRCIEYKDNTWIVTDYLLGNYKKAVLRWHLFPKNWVKNNHQLSADNISILIESNTQIRRIEVVNSFTSLFYLSKSKVPVLEVEISSTPATIVTKIELT